MTVTDGEWRQTEPCCWSRLGSADERQSTLTDIVYIESGSRLVANEVVKLA